MKVAVSASGTDLDAQADPRFGRCANYLIVDTETMEFEVLENTAAMQGSGAGISAAQLVANAGVEAVISGNMGPNAYQALAAGNLPVYTGASGTVRQAIEAFNAGQLAQPGGANVAAHAGVPGAGMGAGTGAGGMGVGTGPGVGMGMGRGMGMGGGGGRGMGMAGGQFPQQGPGQVPPQAPSQQMPPQAGPAMGQQWNVPPAMAPEAMREQQLQVLKSQAQMLKQQLELLNSQIEQLEQSIEGKEDQ